MGCHRHCYSCEGPGKDACLTCAVPASFHSEQLPEWLTHKCCLGISKIRRRLISNLPEQIVIAVYIFSGALDREGTWAGANLTVLLLKTVRVWKNVQLARMRPDRWLTERSWDTVCLVTMPVPPVTARHPEIASHALRDTCISRKCAWHAVLQGRNLPSWLCLTGRVVLPKTRFLSPGITETAPAASAATRLASCARVQVTSPARPVCPPS